VAALAKTWRACAPSIPHSFGGPAGFQVSPDGHFYALGFDASGGVTRQTGFQNEGSVVGVSAGSAFIPYMVYADGSFSPDFLSLSADGKTLYLSNEAGNFGPYVATSDPVAVQAAEPAGAHEAAHGCSVVETGIHGGQSAANATSALIGTWAHCDVSSAIGAWPSSSVAVLEFDADGSWYFLDSARQRLTDPLSHGMFQVIQDGPGWDGSPTFQLNLANASGGTFIEEFAFSSQPVKLWLMSEGGEGVFSAE
jgi:hypothetical protein